MAWDMPYPLDPKMMELVLQAQAIRNKSRGATGSWGPPQASSLNYTMLTDKPPQVPRGYAQPTQTPISGQAPGMVDPTAQDNSQLMGNVAAGSMELAGGEDRQAALQQQMEVADQLRNTPLPEGRGYGGVYTAANPLEFLGSGLKQYQGWKQRGNEESKDSSGITTKRKGLLGKMQTERQNTEAAIQKIQAAILRSSQGNTPLGGGSGGF